MRHFNFETNIQERMPQTGKVFYVKRMTADYAECFPFDVDGFIEDIYQKYQQMEQNAQTELAKLQQNSGNQMQQSQKQLNDSIHNFLSDYAKKNNYDMILFKSATGYINPSLEVTDEVIEGLNKRYTKVAKK